MRDIKFKAWDKKQNKFRDCFDLYFENDILNNIIVGGFGQNDNIILIQFTGMKDKNSVDIYEGDIVETELGHIFEIGFKDGRFGCMSDGYLMTFGNEREVMKRIEVIGNIYKNKELLK